jgi:hypothetical protein
VPIVVISAPASARHLRDFALYPSSASPPGDVAVRHPLDCGRQCLLCHWDKFLEPRRTRERRAWLKDMNVAMAETP